MIWIGPGEYPYRVGPFPNAPHMRAVTAASSPIPEGIDFTPGWVRTSSGWLPFRNPADPTELWIYENEASRNAREMVPRESALAITRPRLGVQIEKLDDGPPFISHCPRESFAHADGLVCGDELVSIAGKSVGRLSVDEVIALLRASPRPTPIAVRRWALRKLNSRAFAVWIGPNNYRYRSQDMESAAPSGKHRVVTDTVIAQVVAFGSGYRWVNTVKGWLPIFNPSDPTEVWVWEPPSSRRSRNMVRTLDSLGGLLPLPSPFVSFVLFFVLFFYVSFLLFCAWSCPVRAAPEFQLTRWNDCRAALNGALAMTT